jgi:hypothetical protein
VFTWDSKAQRFRGTGGRFVKRDAVSDALEKARIEGRKRVSQLTQDLRDGKINLPQWQISMRDEIRAQHLLHAGIARGGKAQLSPSDLGRVGQLTRVQYERLNNYARQIERGLTPNPGRSQMYVNMAHGTFVESERKMKSDSGYQYEENVLSAKESCDGCLAESSRGRVPIGSLVQVGLRTCMANCQCDLVYYKEAA